ncbi:MAG: tetratricopeptide repeat protein [Ferruginibacter sp.]
MSRKKKLATKTEETVKAEIPAAIPQLLPSWSFKLAAIIVFIFSFGLYFNTVLNEYALDDGIVITDNQFTKKGFAGVSEILSNESFAGLPGVSTELSGGRYRPLSIATFAMEYGIFGPKPSVSHLINALLYGFLCVLLFYFLREYVFRNNASAAFIATLIFAVHPLHTDVVSNIKGRDEVLCLLLLLISLITYLKYFEKRKTGLLVVSLIAYFLSLLAKENGITFIAVVPLVIYFFMNKKFNESLKTMIPFVLVFTAYLLIRLKITGLHSVETQEVMNAPFILATGSEAFATKLMILGKDLWMLVFPHPLSFDYSYNQIPYVNFTDWKCILSILINAALVFLAIKLFNKKHMISFAILFYYITLSITTNFVFDVGSPFNERFLFQPSIGFAIAIAFLLNYLGTIKPGNPLLKTVSIAIFVFIIAAGSIKTFMRNFEWKNNDSLFIADVVHTPNSAKTNNFTGVAWLKKTETEKDSAKREVYFEKAIPYFNQALKVHPDFADAYIDLGNIYAQQGKLEKAKEVLMKAKAIYATNNVLAINMQYLGQRYEAEAKRLFDQKKPEEAIKAANSSLECFPANVGLLYNLGGYYLTMHNVPKAREMWTKALELEPNNANIKSWLAQIANQ